MMRHFDDNKECVKILDYLQGSLNNRFREVYNKGYKDGLKDGASKVIAEIVDGIAEKFEIGGSGGKE